MLAALVARSQLAVPEYLLSCHLIDHQIQLLALREGSLLEEAQGTVLDTVPGGGALSTRRNYYLL